MFFVLEHSIERVIIIMITMKGRTSMLDVRPISDLRNRFSEVEKEIHDNGKPIIFTTNGKASMVTISFAKFSKMAHLDYIERFLDEADAFAKSHPETLTHQEVFSKIRKKVNG
jgi:PHD/YefM family antitoxin component YafN of YafNO toxin-antitoxin module